jgi:hypothetical protein
VFLYLPPVVFLSTLGQVHPIWWTVLEVLFVFLVSDVPLPPPPPLTVTLRVLLQVLGHLLALGLYFAAQKIDGTQCVGAALAIGAGRLDVTWLAGTQTRTGLPKHTSGEV